MVWAATGFPAGQSWSSSLTRIHITSNPSLSTTTTTFKCYNHNAHGPLSAPEMAPRWLGVFISYLQSPPAPICISIHTYISRREIDKRPRHRLVANGLPIVALAVASLVELTSANLAVGLFLILSTCRYLLVRQDSHPPSQKRQKRSNQPSPSSALVMGSRQQTPLEMVVKVVGIAIHVSLSLSRG